MDNLLASMAMYITAMFGYDVSSSYIPIPVIATFIFLTTIISFTYAYEVSSHWEHLQMIPSPGMLHRDDSMSLASFGEVTLFAI